MSEKLNLQKFLCLQIQGMNYLLPLQEIKEIIGETKITPLPNVPNYIKGLINLRGQVISILDPGTRMGLAPTSEMVKDEEGRPQKKCTVITETSYEGQDVKLGLLVDDVIEVQSIHPDQIEGPPQASEAGIQQKFISSVVKGKEDQSMVLVLKLDALVSELLQYQKQNTELAS